MSFGYLTVTSNINDAVKIRRWSWIGLEVTTVVTAMLAHVSTGCIRIVSCDSTVLPRWSGQ